MELDEAEEAEVVEATVGPRECDRRDEWGHRQ